MISDIKNKIKIELEKFVSSGDLKKVKFQGFGVLPYDLDAPAYPVATITSAKIVGDQLDNASHLMTYTYGVYITFNYNSNETDISRVEKLLEKIMLHFQEQTTMANTFQGQVKPMMSEPQVIDAGKNRMVAEMVLAIQVATEVQNCV